MSSAHGIQHLQARDLVCSSIAGVHLFLPSRLLRWGKGSFALAGKCCHWVGTAASSPLHPGARLTLNLPAPASFSLHRAAPQRGCQPCVSG